MGSTIIEKFESHADRSSFAVVILTADDKGCLKDSPGSDLKLRARQNVVFELGYFIGKLSRKHVCALYEKDVEIPSDYEGVLYVLLDQNDAWQFQLAREMKAAGFNVDMNKI